jgi:dienelactone hydrolase
MPVMPSASRSRQAAVAALTLIAALALPTAAHAATPTRHSAPTAATAAASRRASSAVTHVTVPASADARFRGGTVYAPANAAGRKLGAVIVTPGFAGTQADMAWYGDDLAAQGFVVFTIDTLTEYDLPDQRSTEMLAAADYLTGRSAVKAEVDPGRVAVLGFSMGGGGALQAAQARPSLKAAVALMPYDLPPKGNPEGPKSVYPSIRVPTLIMTGQNDTVAPPAQYGKPAYDSIPIRSAPKQYLELRGAGHESGQGKRNGLILSAVTSYLKRYLDGNRGYRTFICPGPSMTYRDPFSVARSSCFTGS